MPRQPVRISVLHLLSTNEGLTEQQIVGALRPNRRVSFAEEVEHRAGVTCTLRTLKSEHRTEPTKRNGVRCWNITPRGRRQY
jgi:hypothetical protein